MGIQAGDAAIAPGMQSWKYWQPHPLTAGSRSRVLLDGDRVVAHGAMWPIRLRGSFGERSAFHLIDWAAAREAGGAGMEVMRLCGQGAAAIFSIGGSAMTRKIVPIFGFRPQNRIAFLSRPLHPFLPAWPDSPRDWKMPARLLRNLVRYLAPAPGVPRGWRVEPASPDNIPESLFYAPSDGEAASARNAALLDHVMSCPAIERWRAYLLHGASGPEAYFVLCQVGREVRVADFGPPGLDEAAGFALAAAALGAARNEFPGAVSILAATTEPAVEAGFLRAGLRICRTEMIKVLKLDPALQPFSRYRLTLLDWDAICR